MKAIEFLKSVKSELHKITWLTRKEVLTSSVLVIVVAAISSLLFFLLDAGLFRVIKFILNIG